MVCTHAWEHHLVVLEGNMLTSESSMYTCYVTLIGSWEFRYEPTATWNMALLGNWELGYQHGPDPQTGMSRVYIVRTSTCTTHIL